MRRLVIALALVVLASDAFAGDYDVPILRGSAAFVPAAPTYTRWSGFYAGGQLGYGIANVDFSQATKDLVANALRETALESEQHPSDWQVLGRGTAAGTSFGGFVGFNSQWDDVIVGLELNYNHGSFFADAPVSPISRTTTAGGHDYVVNITGTGTMRIRDYGTVRGRAGYVMGNFLPYVMAGFAMGRADVTRTATITGTEDGTPFTFSDSDSKSSAFIYGWAVGGGLDVAVMPNVFLRGEVEYVDFAAISGMKANISTARVGAGLKF